MSSQNYVLLEFRCGLIFHKFSASNSVIAAAAISLVFHGDCVISGGNSKCPFFSKISGEFITRFRCCCIALVAFCDHGDSAWCTPFVTKLFMTSILHYDVTFIDVETVGSGGAASKQGFHAYHHVLKLHVKCTVPVGSSRYTHVVTFAWSRAKAKAVTLASGGETTDYFFSLPNASWITEILIFSIYFTEKQERWNIALLISVNVLKK